MLRSHAGAFLLGLLVLTVSCSDDEGSSQDDTHSISSVSPSGGKKGTLVTISGEGFAADSSRMKVYFNGRIAAINSVTENKIVVVVPAGAGPGFVIVSKDGNSVGGPYFDFIYTANITTFSGSVQGYVDGSSTSARFNWPRGLAIDDQGNLMVADEGNQVIRRVFPNGSVVTFSGSGLTGFADGPPGTARFNEPYDIDFDAAHQDMYVADKGNHCIRKISYSGDVTTVAGTPQTPGYVDGAATIARLKSPTGVAWRGELFSLLIADNENHCIRKLDHLGVISTFAGSGTIGFSDGTGSGARFNGPLDVSWDSSGYYFVTDAVNNNVRRITLSATVSTVAGSGAAGFADGQAALAEFNSPQGVCASSGVVVVCDELNNRIRLISGQQVFTIAGSGISGDADGEGSVSRFFNPGGIVRDQAGIYYISDTENHRIRKMVLD